MLKTLIPYCNFKNFLHRFRIDHNSLFGPAADETDAESGFQIHCYPLGENFYGTLKRSKTTAAIDADTKIRALYNSEY